MFRVTVILLELSVFLEPSVAGYLPVTRESPPVFALAKGVDNKDTASHADLGPPFDVGPRQ